MRAISFVGHIALGLMCIVVLLCWGAAFVTLHKKYRKGFPEYLRSVSSFADDWISSL